MRQFWPQESRPRTAWPTTTRIEHEETKSLPAAFDDLPRDFLTRGSDAEFRLSIYAMVQSVGRLLACRDAFGRELELTPSQFVVLMGVAHCQGTGGVTSVNSPIILRWPPRMSRPRSDGWNGQAF